MRIRRYGVDIGGSAVTRWTVEQDAWLGEVFAAGYTLDMISRASKITVKTLKGRANRMELVRPKGYIGKRASQMAAELPKIPAFPLGPGRPSDLAPVVRSVTQEIAQREGKRPSRVVIPKDVDLDVRHRPKGGWIKRCQACPTKFVSDDLDRLFCAACLENFDQEQQEQAAEARRAATAPAKSPMKTSSWFARS